MSLVSLIRVKWFTNLPETAIINSGLSTLLGLILTTAISIIYNRKFFKKTTVFLFHKTPYEDIWRDILDLENGSNLKVYLRNKEYYLIGHYKNHEEKGNDSWFALSAFAKYDMTTNTPYAGAPSYLNHEEVIIAIKLSDVDHIEIF